MGRLVAGIDSLYDDRVVPLKQIKHVSDDYAVNIVDLLHKYRAESITKSALLANINDARNTADNEWKAYLSTQLTAEEKHLVDNVESKLQPVLTHLKNLIVSINSGEFLLIPQKQFVYELYQLFDPLSASYQALIDLQLKEASDFKVKADENYQFIKLIMSVIIAILILLLLIVAYFIYSSILNLGSEVAYH